MMAHWQAANIRTEDRSPVLRQHFTSLRYKTINYQIEAMKLGQFKWCPQTERGTEGILIQFGRAVDLVLSPLPSPE